MSGMLAIAGYVSVFAATVASFFLTRKLRWFARFAIAVVVFVVSSFVVAICIWSKVHDV